MFSSELIFSSILLMFLNFSIFLSPCEKEEIFFRISPGDCKYEKCQPPSLIICTSRILSSLQNEYFLNFKFRNHCGDLKFFFKHIFDPSQSPSVILSKFIL